MAIKHLFTTPKPDTADSQAVQPSHWNAPHLIESGTIGFDELALDARGLDYLGGAELGSAANSTGQLTVPLREILLISVRVTGLSAASQLGLRFNGNSAANYWWTGLRQESPTAGTFASNEATSTTAAALHSAAVTTHSSFLATVLNIPGFEKYGFALPGVATGVVSTAGIVQNQGFGWFVQAGQISTIELMTLVTTANMSAGSAFGVWGKNFF